MDPHISRNPKKTQVQNILRGGWCPGAAFEGQEIDFFRFLESAATGLGSLVESLRFNDEMNAKVADSQKMAENLVAPKVPVIS